MRNAIILTFLMPLVILAGCRTLPQMGATQTPKADATLSTVAESIGELKQDVKQVQVAVSMQTQNFQLDEQRAKVEEKKNRNLMRLGIAGVCVSIGMILLALCTPSFATGTTRAMLVIVGACLVCAPVVLLVWPW